MSSKKTLVVKGQSGVLPSGMKWMEMDGEIWVYGKNAMGENEWLVPVLSLLDPADADEVACLGTILNQEAEQMEKDAHWYGTTWVDCIIGDGELDEWQDMDYFAFQQALGNADDPAFTPDSEDVDYSSVDAEFYVLASDAAWNALRNALGDDED